MYTVRESAAVPSEGIDVLMLAGPRGADRGSYALVHSVSTARACGYRGAIFVLSKNPGARIEKACLCAGADDFATSSMSASVLLARVDRLVARQWGGQAAGVESESEMQSRRPSVELVESSSVLRIDGFNARLSPSQFRVVACLMRTPNTWVSCSELLKRALGFNKGEHASSVRGHVFGARQALERYEWFLHGWRDRGYMWSLEACDTEHCRKHLAKLECALAVSSL